MQERNENNLLSTFPSCERIESLIDDAAKKTGSYKKLADEMQVSAKLVSNWKHGIKRPSAEVQAELAVIAGRSALAALFINAIERSEGTRRERLEGAFKQWTNGEKSFLYS